MTRKYIQLTFKRPSYSEKAVRYLIANAPKVEDASHQIGRNDRSNATLTYSRTGRYPEMEVNLIEWAKEVRDQESMQVTGSPKPRLEGLLQQSK